MVSNVAKIILIFAILAVIVIVVYVIINIIIAIHAVKYLKKEGFSMFDENEELYFDTHTSNAFDKGTQSLKLERRRAIGIAIDLHYGDECISRLKAAKTIPEIYRILNTYRDAM